jgi:cytochrome c-type biogenesis protein CcmF
MRPERRSYPVAQSQTTEAAIRSTPAGDLYASITEPVNQEADGQWTLRILYEPLVGFVWLGSLMLVFGGLLSLSDRRLRVGAPKRKTQNAPPVSTLEKV